MSIGELLSHGSFGLGTFNALDGEMVILDGQCFQLRGDGTTRPAAMDQHTPYATVTNFAPDWLSTNGRSRREVLPATALT